MVGDKAVQWVEGYLYNARGHRALEQSVYAAGERAGFSERRLRRAGRGVGVTVAAGCWELPLQRAVALDARRLHTLEPVPQVRASARALTVPVMRARRAA